MPLVWFGGATRCRPGLGSVNDSEVRVSRRKRSYLLRSSALLGALVSAGVVALSELPATAAAAPTTPPSTVSCGGTISPDAGGPAAGNANPYDYSFSCGTIVTGATPPSG